MMYRYTLTIEGMRCGMCESHINDVIRRNFPVKKVSSNRKKNQTVIETETALDQDKLEKAIQDTGYPFRGLKVETFEKKRFALFHR